MNSIHDLGGMHGFGPIPIEDNEPYFHADWERRMFGIASAIAYPLDFNDDQFRREIERVPPAKYLSSSYYELWFYGILGILEERKIATLKDIENYKPSETSESFLEGVVKGDEVDATIAAGASARSETVEVPKVVSIGGYSSDQRTIIRTIITGRLVIFGGGRVQSYWITDHSIFRIQIRNTWV